MAHKAWPWLVFALLFSIEAAIGYYMAVELHFIYGDALSRLTNAFYVLYSRDPHLGAIGFIWNPLPSFLTLPLLLIRPLFPKLVQTGFPIVIVSAIFAALTAMTLVVAFRKQVFSRSKTVWPVSLCIAFFALNPFILWYGANGMSEAIFGFFLLTAVICWTQWLTKERIQALVLASLSLSFAFLTRYEAIPFAAAMAAATILVMMERKAKFRKIESSILVLILPFAFSVLVWIWLNYSIMGDAFYFLTSSYSNAGQSTTLDNNSSIAGLIGHPAASLLFAAKKTAVFLLPYVAILIFRLLNRAALRSDFIALTLLTFSIPLFQTVMLTTGSSFGWLRFFFYPLLIAMAWLPYEFAVAGHRGRIGLYHWSAAVAFAASAVMVAPVMNQPNISPEEYTAIHMDQSDLFKGSQNNRINARLIDDDVFESHPKSLVLADSFRAFETILHSQYPERFVNTTDRDFRTVLLDPLSFGVEYILVPEPEGLGMLDAVNRQYPDLYDNKYDWAKLLKELDGKWRLFQITGHPVANEQVAQ